MMEQRTLKKAEMIIANLLHRGASKYDIEAEIEHRKNNIVPNDEKCFAYKTEELELALKHWEEFK